MSNRPDLSRRSVSDAEADRLIDDVAREMTVGEAPVDLRERVMARLATNGERRTTNVRGSWFAVRGWMLAPIAAAAIIVAAVFVARPQREAAVASHKSHVASPITPGVTNPATSAEPPRPATRRLATDRLATNRLGTAGLATGELATSDSSVAALAPAPLTAASLTIDTLTTGSLTVGDLEAPSSIAIAPLATPEGERQ